MAKVSDLPDNRRDRLTEEWLRLRCTWPSDGWDGAAQARADHDAKVRAVAGQLAEIHAIEGHGPFEWFGVGQENCICKNSGGSEADPRRIDRYGEWR